MGIIDRLVLICELQAFGNQNLFKYNWIATYSDPPSHCLYVTGYWKTDHVRTFGQLLFIGPANSHTHTLPVHCCINGLS